MKMNSKVLLMVLAVAFVAYPMNAFSQEAEVTVEIPQEVMVEMVMPTAEAEVTEEAPVVEEVAETTDVVELSGSVVSIDLPGQFVVVQYQLTETNELTETAMFYFSESVKISKGGQEVTSSELKEGDMVAITYQTNAEGNKVINTLAIEG